MEDVYKYMKLGDYDRRIEDLASIAMPEQWNFPNSEANGILKNYLRFTFARLEEENKVVKTNEYTLFNTGLFTPYYQEIYAYGDAYNGDGAEWKFKNFYTEYELGRLDLGTLPERADYFENPELLIFDWHYPVIVQYEHILDDERNKKRLPESVIKSFVPLQTFRGCVDLSIKRTIANYKLAVPQYYNGKIQLLLPLYFGNDDKPELALVISKMKNNVYLGHTCLTLDMAYNNARLIARPESNWLMP